MAARLVFFFAATSASVCLADPPPTPQHPELPQSIRAFLAGDWAGAGAFTGGRPLASTLSFEPTARDSAIEVRYAEMPPNKFAYTAVVTVDSVTGDVLMLMGGDNSGGGRLFRATSASGDKLAFVSTTALHAWFALERITFLRRDDRHITVTYEMSRDGQTWRTGDQQDFERRS